MTSSRRSSSAADRAERMVSHNRYTSEQKRFFAVNLKLWNQKLISKDEVIKRFREKFNDQKFGYSQYRYLRQEVGRDVEFGAPLLQTQEQNGIMPIQQQQQQQQPMTYAQVFPPQQPQTVPAPQAFYADAFAATPATDSLLFSQQNFSGGYGDFPDIKLLLEGDIEDIPATEPTKTLDPTATTTLMPFQQEQSHHSHLPNATDVFECTGGGPCTIPVGAPHRHEPDGSIVFPNENAIVSMIAMEKMLVHMENSDKTTDGPNPELPVSCTSGPSCVDTTTSSQQDSFIAAPTTQNLNSNNSSIFTGLDYQSPLLESSSSANLGTTAGAMHLDNSLTDMVFDSAMLDQLCNSTGQGMTRVADAMYPPTSTTAQYPLLQLPGQNSWMRTAGSPPSSCNNYTSTSLAGFPNWGQVGNFSLAPRTQARSIPSPANWTTQQPRAVMAIPHSALNTNQTPTAGRQRQNGGASLGFGMGGNGMQTTYSPSPAAAPPMMWPQSASPPVVDPDLMAMVASKGAHVL